MIFRSVRLVVWLIRSVVVVVFKKKHWWLLLHYSTSRHRQVELRGEGLSEAEGYESDNSATLRCLRCPLWTPRRASLLHLRTIHYSSAFALPIFNFFLGSVFHSMLCFACTINVVSGLVCWFCCSTEAALFWVCFSFFPVFM